MFAMIRGSARFNLISVNSNRNYTTPSLKTVDYNKNEGREVCCEET